MAIYIAIHKIFENDSLADYEFEVSTRDAGKVRLDKRSGEITNVTPILGDDGRLFARVAYKLKKHWQKNEIPEHTSWAA